MVAHLFILSYVSLVGFWKSYHQMDLLRPTVFFGQKLQSRYYWKTKNATIAFFLFSSFPSPRSFFFSFSFSCDFGASRA